MGRCALAAALAFVGRLSAAGALVRRSGQGVVRGLECVGCALLALHQAASIVLPVRPRYPHVRPRTVGSVAVLAVVGCALIVFLTISWALGAPESPDVFTPADGATATTMTVRCRQCGRRRAVLQSELRDLCVPESLFYCPSCQAYTARCETGVHDTVATAPPREVLP